MAHRTELTCDRCGRFLWSRGGMEWYAKEVSARLTYWPVGAHRSNSGQRIDLCPECAEEFNKFLMMEGNTNE